MRTLVSALLASGATALVFVAFIVPSVREGWRAQGHEEGKVLALSETAAKLRAAMSVEAQPCTQLQAVYHVKATSVYLVNCQGIKSVRVVE